ncbi:hypothetical protein GF339_06485 [candidate division KSB3 bacterium]|uniref:Orotidine 5'-phosphate decarboxylase domain-containing protein n=1 Tax=candidate division KSB3 bacterium TaxID=2044937 RepID=A0A9D5JU02_9BACT|nr:hypothetical protein [candidate division KSB3 bacterium]MBD3324213.1 hypothetical protein [candidate division KSB3 bacterium]
MYSRVPMGMFEASLPCERTQRRFAVANSEPTQLMASPPLLQIALDSIHSHEIFRVADLIREAVDILEVGTVLLKKEGTQVVSALKERFPDKLIFVDTKTLDLGKIEAQVMFEAGADIMSVCGVASDATIGLVLREAHALGKQVMIDLIGLGDCYRQVKRLSALQPDYLTVYTGIDERTTENTLFEKLEIISQISPIPVAVSGGVELDDLPYLLVFRPAIIIVGTAITRASRPDEVAQRFWESIHYSPLLS